MCAERRPPRRPQGAPAGRAAGGVSSGEGAEWAASGPLSRALQSRAEGRVGSLAPRPPSRRFRGAPTPGWTQTLALALAEAGHLRTGATWQDVGCPPGGCPPKPCRRGANGVCRRMKTGVRCGEGWRRNPPRSGGQTKGAQASSGASPAPAAGPAARAWPGSRAARTPLPSPALLCGSLSPACVLGEGAEGGFPVIFPAPALMETIVSTGLQLSAIKTQH